MRVRVSTPLRIAAAAAFALGWAQMRAQNPSVDAMASGTAADAIAGAKKDFEAIKSARDAALLPKGGLPRVSLPELPASAPSAGTGMKAKIAPPDPKPGNWLVDAMEKQSSARNSREKDPRSRERRSRLRFCEATEGADEQASTHRTGDREPGDTSLVVNPLMSFLGDWMTPQDYALLKPGLTQSFDPAFDARNPAALGTPGIAATLGGVDEFAFGRLPSTPTASVPSALPENPYLQSLQPDFLPAPAGSVSEPVSVSSIPAATSRSAMSPPPQPIPPTRIPEFARPPADDKYFKQLKRF